jgi:hypothetical protein
MKMLIVISLFKLLAPLVTFAQNTPQPPRTCQLEIQKFCSQITPEPEVLKCLIRNQENASLNCKEDVQRMAQLMRKSSAGIESIGGAMGGLGLASSPMPILNYGGSTSPQRNSTQLGLHRVSFAAPVYKSETASYGFFANYGSLQVEEPLTLSKTGADVPSNLFRTELGGQFSRKLADQKSLGARLSLGNASDQVDSKNITFNLNLSFSEPGSENSHWVYFIYFSNNSPILNYLPIPGFVYFYRGENWTGMVGFPFASIHWMPVTPWTYSFSILGPTVNSDVSYGQKNSPQIFTGFSLSQQSFLREDREEDKDRLFFQEKKLFLGFRSPLSEKLHAELQGGYVFDRFIHEGTRFDRKERGETSLGNSWFAAWNLRASF